MNCFQRDSDASIEIRSIDNHSGKRSRRHSASGAATTGLLLALFMWGHMAFVSTILISKDAMWMVTKAFEGYFVTGRSYPLIVSAVVAVVLALVVVHAG